MLFDIFNARYKQGSHTMAYPDGPAPVLPDRFAGRPDFDPSICADCEAPCQSACPTGAIVHSEQRFYLDLGKCIFCRRCEHACIKQNLHFTKNHQLAANSREALIITDPKLPLPSAHNARVAKRFGKSFTLRVVSAGGCGACEADTNVLNTLAWDLSRFGIHYAASPRHADGLILIGPVTNNMIDAVQSTYDAIPQPKTVIAVGSCAISGGIYADSPACQSAAERLPADLFIPGCPSHPLTILDGFLRFIGRIPE